MDELEIISSSSQKGILKYDPVLYFTEKPRKQVNMKDNQYTGEIFNTMEGKPTSLLRIFFLKNLYSGHMLIKEVRRLNRIHKNANPFMSKYYPPGSQEYRLPQYRYTI